MNRQEHLAVAVLLVGCTLGAPSASAQQSERPREGKIDRVEREARRDGSGSNRTSGDDDEPPFLVRLLLHLVLSRDEDSGSATHAPDTGQGYLPYPYADRSALETFVLRNVARDRGYNALSAFYYRDVGSSVRGVQVTWDGALGPLAGNVEYTFYREPTLGDVDEMHLLRLGVGGALPAGDFALVRLGVGLRGIVLDNGDEAAGPDLEAAASLFPKRPWVVSATGRVGAVRWSWNGRSFVWDASLGVGYLLGRVEVTATHRWTQIGHTPKFAGPMLGLRFWF